MKRNLSRMFRTGVAAAAALLCAMPFQAAAEDYPSRPITLIMPFGAGNAPDTAARIIGDYLQRKHNITLLITSKPGGSGIPATLETVRARPDGYTISLTSANVLTVVPQYKKCGFTYKDLAPVAQVNVFTMGWGVRADSGIASVQDLMDKAKAERGKYSLASPGRVYGPALLPRQRDEAVPRIRPPLCGLQRRSGNRDGAPRQPHIHRVHARGELQAPQGYPRHRRVQRPA